MKSAFAAFKFLTLASRFHRAQVSPQQVGAAIPYFPLVGIVLGLVLVLLNRLLDPHLESEILGVLLIAVLALLTGAIHYEGLQNTFDALSVKTPHGEETTRSRAFGILAIVFVVLLKVRALEVTGETRSLGLLLTPLFARWSLVIFLYGTASIAEGTARILADNVKAWHLALTTVVTLALAAFLVGRTALWIGLCLSLFALLSRSYLRRRNDCIDSDNFGAVVELSETLSFVLFASLQRNTELAAVPMEIIGYRLRDFRSLQWGHAVGGAVLRILGGFVAAYIAVKLVGADGINRQVLLLYGPCRQLL